METSIKRAYREVCRTITRFNYNQKKQAIKNNANELLLNEICGLLNRKSLNQNQFDKWHEEACNKLINTFKNQIFYYGQAQKWINMTFKYLALLDYNKVKIAYEYCHVPIDAEILKNVNYEFNCSWSKIDNYKEYLKFQNWFRSEYKGIPLDVEFTLWLDMVMTKS